MTSNVVKCSSCNIVINEVLAFVYNKISVMDEMSLSRICVTAFTAEDILKAKKLLFEAVPMKKMINRKKDEKSRKDLEDIIDLLKHIDATDPERLPIFVARELHKLPPVTFDHLDASRLLKDVLLLQGQLSSLQGEVDELENKFVTRQEIQNFKLKPCNGMELNSVNEVRGGCLSNVFECDDSGMSVLCVNEGAKTPILDSSDLKVITDDVILNEQGQDYLHVEACTSVSTVLSEGAMTKNGDSLKLKRVEAPTVISNRRPVIEWGMHRPRPRPVPLVATTKCARELNASVVGDAVVGSDPQVASINRDSSVKIVNVGHVVGNKNEEWTVVKNKKRLRNKFFSDTGKATNDCNSKFRAAWTKVPLYISNICKEACEEDIINYIRDKTQTTVTLEKITSKSERDYNSYKFYVDKSKLSLFLNDNLWPEGIHFRQFVLFRNKDGFNSGTSVSRKQS